jgi:hypothetical protein
MMHEDHLIGGTVGDWLVCGTAMASYTADWLHTTSRIGSARCEECASSLLRSSKSAVTRADLRCSSEHLPHAHVTCIDTFDGPHEARFDANVSQFAGRVEKIKARSTPALDALHASGRLFDVVYLDGPKARGDVLVDTMLAWRLLKPAGIFIWDDHLWQRGKLPDADRPQQAIDLFCSTFSRAMTVLHWDRQVVVEKRAEWPRETVVGAVQEAVRYRLGRWRRRGQRLLTHSWTGSARLRHGARLSQNRTERNASCASTPDG